MKQRVGLLLGWLVCAACANAATETRDASFLEDLLEVLSLRRYNTRLVVLSTMLLGITSGLIGTFLLLRKRSLMGDALSHATLPGIAIAFIIAVKMGGEGKSLPALLIGATVTGFLGMLLVLAIRNTTRLKDDTAMGIVLSVFFGIGVALLGIIQNLPQVSAAGLESFIYGKTASMVWKDFVLIACVTVVVGLACVILTKEFAILCFDEGFASAQGWPTGLLDALMLGLVAAVTVIGLQAVGLILIIAFLTTPATAARFWTHDLHRMLLLSGIIGGVSGWLGASVSALYPGLPAGALIVLAAAAIFLASMLFGSAGGVLPRYLRKVKLQRKVGRQHLLRAVYEILERNRPDPQAPIENLPVTFEEVLSHRSWSQRQLKGLLWIAEWEDHVEDSPSGTVRLSESGFGEAARVTRNHRLWEMFLIRHADIAPSHVDRDADMVEHVLGAEMVRQLESEVGSSLPILKVPTSPHTIEATEGAS